MLNDAIPFVRPLFPIAACTLFTSSCSRRVSPVPSPSRVTEKNWQMHIPGYALPNSLPGAADPAAGTGGAAGAPASNLGPVAGVQVRTARRGALYGVGEAHRKRLALVHRLHNKEAKRAAAAAAAASGTGGPAAASAASDAKGGAAAIAAAAQAKKRKRPNEE